MTDIKGDNQSSAARANLRTLLEAANDPTSRKNVNDFLYESDPRSKAAGFGGYPIIYIENYSVETTDVNVGGNLFNKEITWEFHIVVRDDKADQRQYLDDITDSIQYLADYSDRQTLAGNGVGQPDINRSQRFTGIDRNDEPVLRREFEITAATMIDMEQVDGSDPYA